MSAISRRRFLATGAAGTGYLAGLKLHADPLGMPMGFQLYGVREQASKDLDGTLKQVAAIGYKRVELCSFPAYANSGFGPLADMKPTDIRKAVEGAGLRGESCHFHFDQFEDARIQQTIDYAHGLGLRFMMLSSPRQGAQNANVGMDEWKFNFDFFNKAGAKVKKAGMRFGYHNHSNEWKKIDGVLVYDEMLRDVDPAFVQLQMDLGGVVSSGYDPVAYLSNNPGRFCSLHVKDGRPRPADAPPPNAKGPQAGSGSPIVGKGPSTRKKLFPAAKKGGIKNYFVEMEVRPPQDPFEALRASYAYLHALNV